MKKNLIRGTLILGIAGIIAKILGLFFRIPLIYMIGEEGIGLYQLTYPLYTFLLAISAGIPVALSKMIAERMAINKEVEAYRIFKVSLLIMSIFGGVASLCIIIFSSSIIRVFKWNVDAYYSLLGISIAPFFTCILSVYRGYFQGLQYMTPPALSQIFEQCTRVIVGVSLAFILLPRGIAAAAGGASFGAAVGSIFGLIWMRICFSRNKINYNKSQECMSSINIFFEILKIAVPISLGQAIGSVMALIDSMMVPYLLSMAGFGDKAATQLYGQLTGKAFVLINVPLTLSIAIAQSTVPSVSESYVINNRIRMIKDIKVAYKMAIILALPCCAGLYVLAGPILSFVFQGMPSGWELMQILSIAAIFIIIAQTSTSILNGIGKTIIPVFILFIGCAVKVVVSLIFIPVPHINIKAAAYGTLFAYLVVALLDIYFVFKYTGVCIDFKEILLSPIICTIVMVFTVVIIYTNMYNLTSSNNKSTTLAILGGMFTYFLMLILTKALNIKDIKTFSKRS